MDESFINRYRPQKFSQMVGQEAVVESFRANLDRGSSRAFILTGPSGVGKTTLARIGARYVGSMDGNTTELAAARYNGVDDMRALTATLGYRAFLSGSEGEAAKAIIVDEAHRISPQGWDAILKDVEEPPTWAYWFFCTTELNRVPSTIRTRCSIYTLARIAANVIFDYLLDIVERERFGASRSVLELCAKEADGSLRQALTFLSICQNIRDRAEAAALILAEEAKQEGSGFALAQALAKGVKWSALQPLLAELTEEPKDGARRQTAEGVRHVIRAYFTKVIIGTKDERVVANALRILDAFSEPCNPADEFSPIVLAVGRVVFGRHV